MLDANLPFTVSISIMMSIALLECITAFAGFSISTLLDSLLPDMEFDAGMAPLEKVSALSSLLGWIPVGKLPVLVLFIIVLTMFGISGLLIQGTAFYLTSNVLSGFVASLFAGIFSLPLIKAASNLFIRFFSREETTALSEDTFIGMIATVVLGSAKKNKPAQAKITDKFGKTHYILVEPLSESEEYLTGHKVLLTGRNKTVFIADKWDE